jgi:hypothetical protein
MHWSLFAFAGLALLFAHGLRLPTSGSRWMGVLVFMASLLITAFAIKVFAGRADIGRTTDFDRIANHAAAQAQQTDAPLILFTGASYSRNAIDPERLTIALTERGYNFRVLNLSLEAASILERDQHLQQFIKQSGEVPAFVFVEVAQAFDYNAAFMFSNSKFNARAIEQFDIPTTLRTLAGISEGACGGTVACLKDTGFLGLHSALNILNVGLIGRGEASSEAGLTVSYDPQYKPRLESRPEDVETILPVTEQAVPRWANSYRTLMRERLKAQSVSVVGYYQPPVQPADQRMYVEALCQTELQAEFCLSADHPKLLQNLSGDVWFDRDHLLDDGAAIYTLWLAEQMIESGVLEGPK